MLDAAERSPAKVTGTLTYRPDSESPWRFQRYYVNEQTGALAEAVVALKPSQPLTLPPTTSPAPKRTKVDQENFQFIPETIAVQTGALVAFTNSDESIHNVMLNHPKDAFNVNLAKGELYEHSFNEPTDTLRPHRLGCVYHGSMRAWVFVYAHPYFALTGKDGRFEISSVPPGEYTLEVHHPAGRLVASQPLVVTNEGLIRKDLELSPENIKKRTPRKLRN